MIAWCSILFAYFCLFVYRWLIQSSPTLEIHHRLQAFKALHITCLCITCLALTRICVWSPGIDRLLSHDKRWIESIHRDALAFALLARSKESETIPVALYCTTCFYSILYVYRFCFRFTLLAFVSRLLLSFHIVACLSQCLLSFHLFCFRFTWFAFISHILHSFHIACFPFTFDAFVSHLLLLFHICCFRFTLLAFVSRCLLSFHIFCFHFTL